MTEVVGRIRQANYVPKRWLATSLVLLVIFAIFPFVAGEFQTNLMAKLLLFGTLGVSLDLVWVTARTSLPRFVL